MDLRPCSPARRTSMRQRTSTEDASSGGWESRKTPSSAPPPPGEDERNRTERDQDERRQGEGREASSALEVRRASGRARRRVSTYRLVRGGELLGFPSRRPLAPRRKDRWFAGCLRVSAHSRDEIAHGLGLLGRGVGGDAERAAPAAPGRSRAQIREPLATLGSAGCQNGDARIDRWPAG